MTRYKKYLKNKGEKLENDFECMPAPAGRGVVLLDVFAGVDLMRRGVYILYSYNVCTVGAIYGRDGARIEL